MTATPATLAPLLAGSVDPAADAGRVQLRLGAWLLLTDTDNPGRRHRLGSWRASAEDVAMAYWCYVEAVAA